MAGCALFFGPAETCRRQMAIFNLAKGATPDHVQAPRENSLIKPSFAVGACFGRLRGSVNTGCTFQYSFGSVVPGLTSQSTMGECYNSPSVLLNYCVASRWRSTQLVPLVSMSSLPCPG